MVHELHKAGYQRIRILPYLSPSGAYWRCTITTSDNVADDGYHLAALFCAPCAPGEATNLQDEIDHHLECAQALPMDAHAWIAPSLAHHALSHNGYRYPVVSLFLQVLQKPARPNWALSMA
jgi:hypothetical protein